MILENINYFQEVVNPLYAFPVVGVVLCALLVFAFGFKTPAQPPSFDFVEQRKVATKKKTKPKEIKASKQIQNGNAHTSEPANNSNSTSANNNNKSQTSSSKPTKNESPVFKKTLVESKTKSKKLPVVTPNPTQAKAPEETPDITAAGEWTQQLSRKDRKNRKGKDTDIVTKPALHQPTSPKKNPQSPVPIEPPAENDEPKEAVEEIPVSREPTPTVVEEVAPVIEEPQETAPSPKKDKKKKAPEAIIQNDVPDTTEIPAPTNVTKETNKKSKKAKEASKSEKSSKEVTSKEETKVEISKKAVDKLEEKKSQKPLLPQVPEKPVIVEKEVPVIPIACEEEEPAVETSVDKDSAKASTNVVFDELGDMWQDAKPQKKKKKVRRE